MKNSLIIKADTIEEAVQTALNILECPKDDINVEVIKPPSKSMFGLRKSSAEVRVTKRNDRNPKQSNKLENQHALIDEQLIDSILENNVDDSLMQPLEKTSPQKALQHGEVLLTDGPVFGAWIQNNQVIVKDNDQRLPIIEAEKNIKVFVNGERISKPELVTSKDNIHVALDDEIIPSSFWIEIKDNQMMATLSIKSGKNIHRKLEEAEPQDYLVIQAKEEVTDFFDVTVEDITNRLKSLGIENGIIYATINEMVKNEITDTEMIIAKGTSPIEGLDGDVEILIEEWEENDAEKERINELEKINYRERDSVLAVEAGQVIATIIKATPGRPGKDLYERIVHPKPVKDVTLKLGKNVIQKNNHIVALLNGRPVIEARGKVVKLDIIKEHIHQGDVSLESGHIRFPGDVSILGNVLDHMTVEAEGKVFVKGTVNRAIIQSSSSMKIEKNVFSSELSAGTVNHIIASLMQILTKLLAYSEHLLAAIDKIQLIRSQQSQESLKLSYLIRLLLEKKYKDFIGLVNSFYSITEENKHALDEEWQNLSNSLKNNFLVVTNSQDMQLSQLENLIIMMKETHETYLLSSDKSVDIELPYAINSTIYSSGNIHVTTQGIYHCNLHAEHIITVTGICRGGHINAEKAMYLNEVGSEYGGKTILQVPVDGKIFVKYAHIDTVIQVGNRMHTCKQGTSNITAFLDEAGNLQLDKH